MALEGDGRWHSHWFIAHCAQTTPTDNWVTSGQPFLELHRAQGLKSDWPLTFPCFVNQLTRKSTGEFNDHRCNSTPKLLAVVMCQCNVVEEADLQRFWLYIIFA